MDPDIAFIEPFPPQGAKVSCLRTWLPGHVPPRFAMEVVSATNPTRDYEDAPAKYALLGTRELVVFDPEGLGPASLGGPHLLQVWRLDVRRSFPLDLTPPPEEGQSATTTSPQPVPLMTRVYDGDGPAYSEELGAWLVTTPEGRLRIADDPAGTSLWLTEAEEKEAARREAGSARHQAEAAARTTLVSAIADLCEAYGTPLDDLRRARLASLDPPRLRRSAPP